MLAAPLDRAGDRAPSGRPPNSRPPMPQIAIGNGYVGSRGSLAEGCALSAPVTSVAGVFDRETGSVPGLAKLADWRHLSITIDGQPLRLDQTLNIAASSTCGKAYSGGSWRHRDGGGRVTHLRELRLASLADRHLYAIKDLQASLPATVMPGGRDERHPTFGSRVIPLHSALCASPSIICRVWETRRTNACPSAHTA
jgi:Glycosyl hydrolase family 65, N-terminal domain